MTAPVCVDCIATGVSKARKVQLRRDGTPVPGKRCREHLRGRRAAVSAGSWAQRLQKLYGLSVEEYWELYQGQGGVCYICQRGNGSTKRLSVDHNHATGEIRGLLDTGCNKWVLGTLRDDVEAFQRAVAYLTDPPARKVIGCRIVPSTGAPVKLK